MLAELPARLRSSVASVTAPSPDQVTLKLARGATVISGGPGDAAVKARELAVLMQDSRGLLRPELTGLGGH